MKALYIDGERETEHQFAVRKARVDAAIKSNMDKTDFEIGLLCEPSLGVNVIRERRRELGLLRPKCTISRRLMTGIHVRTT